MSIYDQFLLDVNDELIVDLFAGGGGASSGIEMATGRQVDVAINHDEAAVAMHRANHPQTDHHVTDIFEVCPREVTEGRPVGLLWASPDCTDHSKAKGGKPIRDTKRRALAWVVTRWAGQVRPRVIMMENVEEFVQWGPLVGTPGSYRRCKKRKGKTFKRFRRSLEDHGYDVEWREMRASDYGAPTIRKRFFLIARCDGQPITWPAKTHGPTTGVPYRTAAECIDWSVPMCSIFATKAEAKAWAQQHGVYPPKRPLAEATMRRIARGIEKYVLKAERPFIVPPGQVPYLVPRYGEARRPSGKMQEPRTRSLEEPAATIVPTGNSNGHLVAAQLSTYNGDKDGRSRRGGDLTEPLKTQTTENRHALVASYLARHWGGMVGKEIDVPMPTITTKGCQDQIVTANLSHQNGSNTRGGQGRLDFPLRTQVTANHAGLIASFLQRYNGQGVGQALDQPTGAQTTKDRLGLVTVQVNGEPYVLEDIAMRMLQPHELYAAQGFPPSYVTSWGVDQQGERVTLTKTEQVRMVGNSVPPQLTAALVGANLADLVVRDEVVAA